MPAEHPRDGARRDSRLAAWCELLRLPNLFTVPGDPIVGFLLAGAGRADVRLLQALPAALASVFLYSAGLVSNDLLDRETDRRERPCRPIPSGRIGLRGAFIASVVLFALGIGSAGLAGKAPAAVACVLTGLILLYNAQGKRIPLLGPLNMGLCRGLSLLVGAAVVLHAPSDLLRSAAVLVAAGGLTLYVTTVTLVATGEASGRTPGRLAWLPCLIVVFWLPTLGSLEGLRGTAAPVIPCALAIVAGLITGVWGLAAERSTRPEDISSAVGAFLGALLVIQAGMAALVMSPGTWIALVLFAAWPVAALLGRRFRAS